MHFVSICSIIIAQTSAHKLDSNNREIRNIQPVKMRVNLFKGVDLLVVFNYNYQTRFLSKTPFVGVSDRQDHFFFDSKHRSLQEYFFFTSDDAAFTQ